MDPGDRRGSPRAELTLKVEYAEASELVTDFTENISRGGLFVLTERVYPIGSTVRLVLSFPGLLKPIPITGVVKWAKPDGVGVELAPEQTSELDRLDELIQRIAAGDPGVVARTLRVLVVEDNPHVATLIREGLQGSGRRELAGRVTFRFTHAVNGQEALEALSSGEPFDILIIDIYLPILDGVQVIREVRRRPELAKVPIVAVSAGGATARGAALEAGADFFLDKPMRLIDVMKTLRQLTGLE
jgi:uncharacterized protein (TIGR02266 family)